MNRSALVSLLALPLVACMGGERNQSGECPAGEVCSPKTPYGLLFVGNALAGEALAPAFGPAATAIGGTQDIELHYDRGDGIDVALDLPYDADDDGGLGVEIDHTAGDKPAATVPVEFVTGADTMFAIDDPSPTVRPGESIFVCFAAMNGSRYVYGLTWQFNVDGEASTKGKDAVTRNCVSVAAGSRTAGTTIPVAAAAGGQQLNITVTVDAGTMAREHNVGVLHSESELLRTASPLGERAALSM